MGTEFILTEDDQPDPDTSPAEEIAELLLLTAGEKTGPVNISWDEAPGNF
ncbi:hypothetical protein QFZ36_004231 [Pseudarthrobacter siccitolerans]|uniref:Uncharacterized protein n=1 Tax=Pseudarthrobacter siccitolerans TaxID=861266 RepID=A0ABU0PRM4_9MICC|nr:hypothetical protein [Pseudarthrobacter siccitolerans]MDQ0676605.1 hypothetical protein [Pseudarthrobacter siccitolerans]